jgi:hypothetical protein
MFTKKKLPKRGKRDILETFTAAFNLLRSILTNGKLGIISRTRLTAVLQEVKMTAYHHTFHQR